MLAADLAERAVDRIVAEAEKQAAAMAKRREEEGRPPEPSSDRRKEERKEAREEAKKDKATAERSNEQLGRNLMGRRGAASRKEHSLARAKAVAAILLADHHGLSTRRRTALLRG